jgi:hypothetical protein
MVSNAFKKTGTASNAVKDILAYTFEKINGIPRNASRRALDNADSVIPKAEAAIKLLPAGTSPAEAVDEIVRQQTNFLRSIGPKAQNALSTQYAKNTKDLLTQVPDSFTADLSQAFSNVMTNLQEAGLGKMTVTQSSLDRYLGKAGKPKFELFTDKEIARSMGVPEDGLKEFLSDPVRKGVKDLAKLVNQYAELGTLSGKAGAKKVLDLRKAIRGSLDGFMGATENPRVKALATMVKNDVYEQIGKPFAEHGLADQFIKINKEFSEKADIVHLINSAIKSDDMQAVDALAKKLASKAGNFRSVKDEAKALSDLVGIDVVNNLLDYEAAKHFVSFVPSAGGSSLGEAIKSTAGVAVSPRVTSTMIKYGDKTLNFIKSMGPKQLDTLLRNDNAMRTLFQTPANAMTSEDQTFNELVNQAQQQVEGEEGAF